MSTGVAPTVNDVVTEIRNLTIDVPGSPTKDARDQTVIVDDVSISIRRGQVLGLIGQSGSGKTTIGLAALGYTRRGIRVSKGKVTFKGNDVLKPGFVDVKGLRGSHMCYVAQSAAAAFNPAKRLLDQVVEASVKHGVMTRRVAQGRALQIFERLGIPEPKIVGKRYPHQVSGGQLQRIMIAMALCPEPDLIVFDEPTTALDVTTQLDVLEAIKDGIANTGIAAVYISHDLAVVSQMADHIVVLRDGKIAEAGDTLSIINRPKSTYTKSFVSADVIFRHESATGDFPLLSIERVTARYGTSSDDVLKDVSLEVYPGQTLALVGESGSGKSTLARTIAGLLPPTSGTVVYAGEKLPNTLVDRSRENLREIQFVHQMADSALNPRQRVREIVGRPLTRYFGMRGAVRDARVAELLDQTELGAGFRNRFPEELSGGQKQRVCIARALAARPKLIICDEIISALDRLIAREIVQLLRNLQKDEHVGYIFITHDLGVVRAIADCVAVMYKGEVVRYGSRTTVLSPPFDDYTARLLASVPKLEPGWLKSALATRGSNADGGSLENNHS